MLQVVSVFSRHTHHVPRRCFSAYFVHFELERVGVPCGACILCESTLTRITRTYPNLASQRSRLIRDGCPSLPPTLMLFVDARMPWGLVFRKCMRNPPGKFVLAACSPHLPAPRGVAAVHSVAPAHGVAVADRTTPAYLVAAGKSATLLSFCLLGLGGGEKQIRHVEGRQSSSPARAMGARRERCQESLACRSVTCWRPPSSPDPKRDKACTGISAWRSCSTPASWAARCATSWGTATPRSSVAPAVVVGRVRGLGRPKTALRRVGPETEGARFPWGAHGSKQGGARLVQVGFKSLLPRGYAMFFRE